MDSQTTDAQWHYAIDRKPAGPVDWEQLKSLIDAGQLKPSDLVWREGMAQWAPVATVEGLSSSAAPVAMAQPIFGPDADLIARRRRGAKINCVTLAALSGACLAALLTRVSMGPSQSRSFATVHDVQAGALSIFTGFILLLGALFAAIYLPGAWKTIRQLPSGFRWAGLIGGGMLLGELIAGIVLIVLF